MHVSGRQNPLIAFLQRMLQVSPAVQIQFSQGFIQQQHRPLAGAGFHPVDFRQFQGKHGRADLSARAIVAQIQVIAQKTQVIAVRSANRHPACDFFIAHIEQVLPERSLNTFQCQSCQYSLRRSQSLVYSSGLVFPDLRSAFDAIVRPGFPVL